MTVIEPFDPLAGLLAMTVIAMFNGVEIARSEETIVVEGNHYFPREDVREECLVESARRSICPWKGRASYWSVQADGRVATDAAWTYPKPFPLARRIRGRVAFWNGVEVRSD